MIRLDRTIPIIVLFFLLPTYAHCQSRIAGVVVNSHTGEPLPGANVFVKGELKGTAADEQGRYRLADLAPRRYLVVASMIGYENQTKSVVLEPPAKGANQALTIRFELRPAPVEMEGVTVEGNRDKWLDRLEQFREAFFGTAPNADRCSFVNPETLTFEVRGDTLVAHAEEPLRVRNEALGYELTYHLSRYTATSQGRLRIGPIEFDTLGAQSPEQKKAWMEARQETYRGSYEHFIDALQAGALEEEGFEVWYDYGSQEDRDLEKVKNASEIYFSANAPGRAFLVGPPLEQGRSALRVLYLRENESHTYLNVRRLERTVPKPHQTSLLEFTENQRVLIDVQSGDYIIGGEFGHPGDYIIGGEFGHLRRNGYWGWYETAATALPQSYRPVSAVQ